MLASWLQPDLKRLVPRIALVATTAMIVTACGGEGLFGLGSNKLSVELSVPRLDFTAVGDSQAIYATLTGADSEADRAGSFQWVTSDSSVVRLHLDPLSPRGAWLRATGAGVAQVTVRFAGAKSARLTVAVTQAPARIDVTILGSPLLEGLGAQRNASAIVRDRRGTVIAGATVRWESLFPTVVTISAQGVMTAAGSGSTEIVARFDTVTSRPLPVEVLVGTGLPPAAAVTFVASGSTFCGIALDGATYCTGSGQSGWLGNGTTADSPDPTPVVGGHSFTTLSMGRGGPCGVTADAIGYCWGGNYGLSFDVSPVARLTGVRALSRQYGWYREPGPYTGPTRPSVALGYFLTALRTDGTFFGVGSPGTATASLPFMRVVSTDYQSCGILTNGSLYCWRHAISGGAFEYGFERPFGLGRFVAVTIGYYHKCAVGDGGVVSCVGDNSRGQLGDGTSVTRSTPAPVLSGRQFTEIVSGLQYTCALSTDGAAYCWGLNDRGQLGDGTIVNRSSPTRVAGELSFVALTSENPTCGLTAGGAAYCWGMLAPAGSPTEFVTVPTRVMPTMTFRVP